MPPGTRGGNGEGCCGKGLWRQVSSGLRVLRDPALRKPPLREPPLREPPLRSRRGRRGKAAVHPQHYQRAAENAGGDVGK